MRSSLLTLTAAVVLLCTVAGCSCRESQPPPQKIVVVQPQEQPPAPQPAQQPPAPQPTRQVGDSVIQGPADYLRTTTITVPTYIKKQANLAYTENEIKQYEAMNGRYPESLKELEEWRGEPLGKLPGGYAYSYDPKSGKLDVVAAP